jgi:hypothetical protein
LLESLFLHIDNAVKAKGLWEANPNKNPFWILATADLGAVAPTLAQSGLRSAELPSPSSVAERKGFEPSIREHRILP